MPRPSVSMKSLPWVFVLLVPLLLAQTLKSDDAQPDASRLVLQSSRQIPLADPIAVDAPQFHWQTFGIERFQYCRGVVALPDGTVIAGPLRQLLQPISSPISSPNSEPVHTTPNLAGVAYLGHSQRALFLVRNADDRRSCEIWIFDCKAREFVRSESWDPGEHMVYGLSVISGTDRLLEQSLSLMWDGDDIVHFADKPPLRLRVLSAEFVEVWRGEFSLSNPPPGIPDDLTAFEYVTSGTSNIVRVQKESFSVYPGGSLPICRFSVTKSGDVREISLRDD